MTVQAHSDYQLSKEEVAALKVQVRQTTERFLRELDRRNRREAPP